MTEVILHLYDVKIVDSSSKATNAALFNTALFNTALVQINNILKDGIRIGGIFHSAIQVYGDDEWAFGYCERGTGVFSCPAGKNDMHMYRERIVIGKTNFSTFKVNQILKELRREWPGHSYDMLSKNCNHFSDEFCLRLGVPKFPGWVNRFAQATGTAVDVVDNTTIRIKQAKTDILSAGKGAYNQLTGNTTLNTLAPQFLATAKKGAPKLQLSLFKNPNSSAALKKGEDKNKKPASTTVQKKCEDEDLMRQQQEAAKEQRSYFRKPANSTALESEDDDLM